MSDTLFTLDVNGWFILSFFGGVFLYGIVRGIVIAFKADDE